ncbi:interferon-induced very large GTPase 1-like [Hoplias malabaricus]|uniref:interferon-induced very large GTPase 1-like n=1 Tax=Hoplias malabaricus TaxID=27720 RepID=UPI003462F12A
MDTELEELTVVLFGNSSAVQFGVENILLGQPTTDGADFSSTLPKSIKISERRVNVINLLDLQENECLDSVDQGTARLINENEIDAFVFVLQLRKFTDTDKVGLDWLQRKFGENVLSFVVILFTYEKEEDCDTIIDDLKNNSVLEQLLQKCGDRYQTCSKSMNNQPEMRKLLGNIDHIVSENNHCTYTAEFIASNLTDPQHRKKQQYVPTSTMTASQVDQLASNAESACPSSSVESACPSSSVESACPSSSVESACPSSSVESACPSSSVESACPSSSVESACPSSSVESACPSSSVESACPSSSAESACPSSSAESACPSSSVESVCPSSNVESAYPSSNVESVCPSSSVESACPSSNVESACPSSSVESVCPSSSVESACPSSNVESACQSSNVESVCPSSSVESACPSSNVESACPSSNVESACPSSNVESACPSSSAESACPSSNVESACSSSSVESACPSSNVESASPSSNVESACPSSSVESACPSSSAESACPSSNVESACLSSSVESACPSSSVESVCPSSSVESVCPSSNVESTCPSSSVESACPSSSAESACPSSNVESICPSSSVESAGPSSSAESACPSSSVESACPSSNVESAGPSSSAESACPSSSVKTAGPSSTFESAGPSSSVESAGPSSNVESACPSSSAESACPSSNVESICPSSSVESVCPSSSAESACPSSNVESICPSSSVESADPSSNVESASPSSSAESACPSSSAESACPSSSVESASPSSSVESACPSSSAESACPTSSVVSACLSSVIHSQQRQQGVDNTENKGIAHEQQTLTSRCGKMWQNVVSKILGVLKNGIKTRKEEKTELDAADDTVHSDEEKTLKENTEALLMRLQLKTNLIKKLKPADVLQITADSLKPKEDCAEDELVQIFLQRLLLGDYRARYISIKEAASDMNYNQSGTVNIKEDKSFEGVFFSKKPTSLDQAIHKDLIHPMDVQMAVFLCSDGFLKQLIVTKLSYCQYALPLLVPNPFTGRIEFPLWAFQQVKKSWNSSKVSGKVNNMASAQTPMVAVFRFGSISTSKSQLINGLINEKHDTFFHRNCPGSSRNRVLMDGVVEIAWYCPSGKNTDHFSDCVAFCNLHGDAETHEKQLGMLTEMSSVNVVVLGNLEKGSTHTQALKKLYSDPKPLICLFCEDESPVYEVNKLKYKIGLKGRNQAAVSAELQKTLRECFSESIFRLKDVGKIRGITTDIEDNPVGMKEKEAVLQMIKLLERKKLSKIKEEYLPCQGILWHAWAQKNKELHRVNDADIEREISKKQNEMKQIREKQAAHGFSNFTKLFIETISSCSTENEKSYFLKWVEILLDMFTADDLSALHHKYDEKWSSVLDLKKKHDKSEQIKAEQIKLEEISKELKAATFGLEHILREMGQLYESFVSVDPETRQCEKEVVLSLPKLAAELLTSGHPLELMDGDAAHVPLIWISAVLDELIKKLGDKRVFVLSVLGVQSSGKSTMLNAMFGLQFAVSAGRCTKGAFMQLVKVSKIKVNFDYILVVDTEGLRALELTGISTRHHDNELATFVVGLGNTTIINIMGENPAEMQDVLQIVVQAFLRMKKVKLTPSCLFVHQNVSDITAKAKNKEERRRLQEKLDEMAKLAAKEEVCDAVCFSDVIEFDIKNDVRYFAQLWEGSPPMAPPNPSYSENILELKKSLLQQGSKLHCITLKQLKRRITDLWTALMNENFVFSFKNTLEISVYRQLEEEYGKWTWTLRSTMLRIQDKLHNRIKNYQLDKVEYKLLVEEMQGTFENVKSSMTSFFESEQEKDTMEQWRGRFEKKIKYLHDDIIKQAERELDGILLHREHCKNLEKQKSQYEAKLFEKSKELALSLQNNEDDEGKKKEQFDSLWEKWISELTATIQPMRPVAIAEDIFKILCESYEGPLVISRRQRKEYVEMHMLGDYTPYVKLKKRSWEIFQVKATLSHDDQNSIRNLTLTVIKQTKDLIKSKPVELMGYNPSHIQEIVLLVKQAIKEHEGSKYEFTKEFSVDLSLFVCETAKVTFEDLHEKFRNANDPMVYLKNMKPGYCHVFQNFCRSATSVAAFGASLCSKLGESILQSVYNQTATDLADQMKSDLPEFNGNRSKLEKHILKSLAEEKNFQKYKTYIMNPREHFESFIKEVVRNYMKKENPRALNKIMGIIEHKKQCVITAAQTATEEMKKKSGDANMWLESFSRSLKDELVCETEHLSGNNSQDIRDFQLLTEVVKKEMSLIIEELKKNLNSVSALKMEKFRKRPDEILIEQFCHCCWVQCPFCKAICTNTMEDHDGDHSVPFHRNNGINGWHYRGTENLAIDFCTTSVASDRSFYPFSDSDTKVPWKQYRTAGPEYANWSITPDHSELPYWKWFVCRFQKDLENLYNMTFQENGQIPDQWRKYTEEEAIKSLDEYI